ncbi:orotidine-5'-phosphate decarboxylase [Arachidicoccus rhizosphaerae]|jgi:orotidine-5'-phosphate decarboxylase|uniref:Orotidine-5'-phosphate decarboxylase n=1 Tax=Arachidicoccus rhizosphaerae TaxID=551991 RepID=A0A1H3YHK8_9BACT|nr:orotidine-5'-phosphate decarboxylase [Arachidicoccus rhizosphaerae]SEA11025.1 orotidine-5'-phosphate decarboxylase [Arachidicoccus rhizosphaerae]
MNIKQLAATIYQKRSFLCVGLDTDPDKLPAGFANTAQDIIRFNKEMIEATLDHAVAYKINTAFYEAMGIKGWQIMEETLAAIPDTHFSIADAKRGDIGNTAAQYARTFFETYPFDSVTVAPYMGKDSIQPFLDYTDKTTIVLGLTSNKGADDFERLQLTGGQQLYEKVLTTVAGWGSPDNLMFVVGATQAAALQNIRKLIPEHFLLVPGVGAQGGTVEEVAAAGWAPNCGLLINVSRGVIYASKEDDYLQAARLAAKGYQEQMASAFK